MKRTSKPTCSGPLNTKSYYGYGFSIREADYRIKIQLLSQSTHLQNQIPQGAQEIAVQREVHRSDNNGERHLAHETARHNIDPKMVKIVAYCGIVCSDCPVHKATKMNDDAERRRVVELWNK